jgi:hypothetical protein
MAMRDGRGRVDLSRACRFRRACRLRSKKSMRGRRVYGMQSTWKQCAPSIRRELEHVSIMSVLSSNRLHEWLGSMNEVGHRRRGVDMFSLSDSHR